MTLQSTPDRKEETMEENVFSNKVAVDANGRLFIGGLGGYTLIVGKLKNIISDYYKLPKWLYEIKTN